MVSPPSGIVMVIVDPGTIPAIATGTWNSGVGQLGLRPTFGHSFGQLGTNI